MSFNFRWQRTVGCACYNKESKCYTNVSATGNKHLLPNASDAQMKKKICNQIIFPSCNHLLSNHSPHTHNFKGVVELVTEFGGQEIQTH